MLFTSSYIKLKDAGFNVPDEAIANSIPSSVFSESCGGRKTTSTTDGSTSKLEYRQVLSPSESASVNMDKIVIRDNTYSFGIGDMCCFRTPTWITITCKETPDADPIHMSGDLITIQKYRKDGYPRVKITAEDASGDARAFWASSSTAMEITLNVLDADE